MDATPCCCPPSDYYCQHEERAMAVARLTDEQGVTWWYDVHDAVASGALTMDEARAHGWNPRGVSSEPDVLRPCACCHLHGDGVEGGLATDLCVECAVDAKCAAARTRAW